MSLWWFLISLLPFLFNEMYRHVWTYHVQWISSRFVSNFNRNWKWKRIYTRICLLVNWIVFSWDESRSILNRKKRKKALSHLHPAFWSMFTLFQSSWNIFKYIYMYRAPTIIVYVLCIVMNDERLLSTLYCMLHFYQWIFWICLKAK